MADMLVNALSNRIDYHFSDKKLLEQALTHRSAYYKHNERLEFLGDALLNQIIAAALYHRFPEANEGEMSRMRASLVKEKTLAELAFELHLGDCLRLGSGELKSGGFRRESILADALEAVFGAVYLDGGFTACEAVVLRLFTVRLDKLDREASIKDPKTQLQECLQSTHRALPVYELVATEGDAHAQIFRVSLTLDDGSRFVGVGSSRRRAEQQSAEMAMAQMGLLQADRIRKSEKA